MTDKLILDEVREHYGAIARETLEQGHATCCADITSNCCAPADTIPVEALAAIGDDKAVPDEVIRTSLGCGTPLELAAIKPGETILDLGSGGGLDCFYAARLAGPTGHVIGVDMTPEMLALAEKNRAIVGLTNVEFRRGLIEALPVEDGTVDVIISNCVINLSSDKDAVFHEAVRVLKAGGRVAFSDTVSKREIPAGLRKNMDSWAACVSGSIPAGDYMAKMEAAGFVDVQIVGEPGAEFVYSAKFLGRKPG